MLEHYSTNKELLSINARVVLNRLISLYCVGRPCEGSCDGKTAVGREPCGGGIEESYEYYISSGLRSKYQKVALILLDCIVMTCQLSTGKFPCNKNQHRD